MIGGGPAGLMAAEVLAGAGLSVTVIDRMPSPGRKLLRAGRGGLNLTHSEPLDALLGRYGPARERLTPAIDAFDPDDLRRWCAGLGIDTMVGSSGRVFPVGLRAAPLLRAWLRRLADLGVELRMGQRWVGWTPSGALELRDRDGVTTTLDVEATVLATGGGSWARLGADGTWVPTLAAEGVVVRPLRPANCGVLVAWSPVFAARFAGEPLKNIAVRHGPASARGDAVVTSTGLEGGAVYALSGDLRDALDSGVPVTLTVDLRPDHTLSQLAGRLGRRRAKESTATLLRRARFQPVDVGLLREATANRLPDDPAALAALLKALPIRLEGVAPIDRAISSAGGVAFEEVDDAWMLRRRPGTFVAGEMVDWEAPTGGYLLQATFASAVAAANGTISWLKGRYPSDRW